MAIIIEDGSIVDGANSYVTIAEAMEYCTQRGYPTPQTDDEMAVLLIKSCDYLESFASQYKGYKVSQNQALQFPRYEVYLYPYSDEFPFDAIPSELKKCQLSAIATLTTGVELMPNISPTDLIVREKVDVIETEYADPTKTGVMSTVFTEFNTLIAPLLMQSGASIFTRRV